MVNPPAADSQRAPCRTLSLVGIGGWLPPQLQTARAASLPRTLPCVTLHRAAFRTEGSSLRWEPQPHASAACTPYSSLLGASFKPDVAGRTCILSGRRVVQTQTMAEVARESEVWPSRALESATRALLRPNPLAQLPAFTSARVAVRPASGLRRLAGRLWPRRLERVHAEGYCARP